jgi:hypothetical protein
LPADHDGGARRRGRAIIRGLKGISVFDLKLLGESQKLGRGPALFGAYLGTETTLRAGALHVLNAEYFKRIDALNYTMLHDDGQLPEDFDSADVILVGVSRSSKTPTSNLLAKGVAGRRQERLDLAPHESNVVWDGALD